MDKKTANKITNKLAVFDFDNTISKGYSAIEFLEYLFEQKKYPEKYYKEQKRLLKMYKDGTLSYDDWCYRWAKTWGHGLRGVKAIDIENCAKKFFEEFKKNIHPQQRKLIAFLKEKKYKIIILSVGAHEVISLAAKELEVDEEYSTVLQIKSGNYSGEVESNMYKLHGKEDALKELVEKNVNLDKSLGFGDSYTDIAFMKMLKYPVATYPDSKLRMFAENNEWLIVDETMNANEVIENVKKYIGE